MSGQRIGVTGTDDADEGVAGLLLKPHNALAADPEGTCTSAHILVVAERVLAYNVVASAGQRPRALRHAGAP